MFETLLAGIEFVLLATSLASLAYLIVAISRVAAFGRRSRDEDLSTHPPVTLLKPLCGLDPDLLENLRTFCRQDYPHYQIVFGVADPNDPAVGVVRSLITEYPSLDITLVPGGKNPGENRKAANLANMYPHARHGIIVIADSDMRVSPDYLRKVVAPFADPQVGAVTCLYSGTPVKGFPSAMNALFINEWFFPSVLVALTFQELRYCFGATMAARREALQQIGGFEKLSSYLADDYMLGNLISAGGYKVRLASTLVENIVHEPDFKALFRHELRWARTIRSCQPLGYAFSFIGNNALTLTALYLLVAGAQAGVTLLFAALLLRLLLHRAVCAVVPSRQSSVLGLLPLRDLLCFIVWGASFLGRTVSWREAEFSIHGDGQMIPIRDAHDGNP